MKQLFGKTIYRNIPIYFGDALHLRIGSGDQNRLESGSILVGTMVAEWQDGVSQRIEWEAAHFRGVLSASWRRYRRVNSPNVRLENSSLPLILSFSPMSQGFPRRMAVGKLFTSGKSFSMPGYRFPIARRLLAFARRARTNWLLRHQHPINFWIHMLGIPLALAGLVLFFFIQWPWALALLVLGYLLQWLGHRVEGNDVGEFIPLKRALGLKTVSIAPRYERPGVEQSVETSQAAPPGRLA